MAIATSSVSAGTNNERNDASKRETIRNRINQRAFRSRKQEYVRELEEQVRAFQREGVKATQEVQMAARHVAMENTLLRKFVMAYAKCSDRDIDLLLLRMRDGSVDIPCSFRSDNDASHSTTAQPTSHDGTPRTSTSNTVNSDLEKILAEKSPNGATYAPATIPSQDPQTLPTSTCTVRECSTKSTAPTGGPRQTGDHAFPTLTVDKSEKTYRETSSSLAERREELQPRKLPEDSISCEEAATIIAGLRMRNADETRDELGCADQDSCHIRNITLLQLMNETF